MLNLLNYGLARRVQAYLAGGMCEPVVITATLLLVQSCGIGVNFRPLVRAGENYPC